MAHIKSACAVFLFLSFFNGTGYCRPVSFEDGWTVNQTHDRDSTALLVHYSPTQNFSLGLRSEYMREERWVFGGLQVNNLLKRWNLPYAQANFYLKTAAGSAYSDHGRFIRHSEFAGFSGIAFDWENRRLYCAYENKYLYAGEIEKFFEERVRLGVAPYVAEFGGLHTWVMLEVKHKPGSADNVVLTPFLRFFKKTVMFEIGVSEHGDVMNTLTFIF